MFNLFNIFLMSATFLYVFNKAHYAQTRLVALVPLAMVLVDVCSVSANSLSVPALAIILAALRLLVMGCCFAALRQDRITARAQARRRLRRRLVVHTGAMQGAPMPQYA